MLRDGVPAELAGLTSCDVSDACDALGVPAARDGGLRPLWPRCPAVVGSLDTLVLRPARGRASPLPQLVDALRRRTGSVVLVDLGGATDVQCWGGVLATAARSSGVAGAVVHGAARDVEALEEMAFPTWARAVTPVAAAGRVGFSGAGAAVLLDGVEVGPGWVAVADRSGVVFLPPEAVGEVGRVARAAGAEERSLLASVRRGGAPAS